jgi:hypothetical protein
MESNLYAIHRKGKGEEKREALSDVLNYLIYNYKLNYSSNASQRGRTGFMGHGRKNPKRAGSVRPQDRAGPVVRKGASQDLDATRKREAPGGR